MKTKKIPMLLTLVLGVSIPVLYTMPVWMVFVTLWFEDYTHRMPFDARQWQQNDQMNIHWPDRLCMVDDLLRRRILAQKSREEVAELLGEPDWKRSESNGSLLYEYCLGPERNFIRLDSEILVIAFHQGKVIDAYTRTD